jgi:hypothetical protein
MREYKFELPLNVPGWGGFVNRLITKITENDLWPSTTKVGKIPTPLARRLAEAQTGGHGVEITKADLDSIPDDVWEKIEKVIG